MSGPIVARDRATDSVQSSWVRLAWHRRLAVALVVSIVAHLVVIAAPDLGTTREAADRPVRGQEGRSSFSVNFTDKRESTIASSVGGPAAPPQSEPGGGQPAARGPGVVPFAGAEYYATAFLDKRPQPIDVTELDSPLLRPIVASGKIEVSLWIDRQGKVTDVVIEKSDLPEIFSAKVVAAFKRTRFTPGERLGRRVGSVMRLEIDYQDPRQGGP